MGSVQARPLQKDRLKGSRRGKKGRIRKVLAASACAISVGAIALHAQSTGTLARSQVVEAGGANSCPVVLISFNQDLKLSDQSLSEGGQLLTLRFVPVVANAETSSALEKIETQPSLNLPGLGTAFITLDRSGTQPLMRIRFSTPPPKPLAKQIGLRSLVLSLQPATKVCGSQTPAQPEVAPIVTGDAALQTPALTKTIDPDAAGAYAEQAALLTSARAALTANDNERAIQLLTKLQALPANPYTADAQELLGVARERNGQLAHAKAEYEAYLQTYPDAEGAARVRQRLAAIETVQTGRPAELAQADGGQTYASNVSGAKPSGAVTITSIPRRNESFPPLRKQPGIFGGSRPRDGDGRLLGNLKERVFGNAKERREARARAAIDAPPRILISAYYYLNETTTKVTELEAHTTETESDLQQNSLVLSFNVSDRFMHNGQEYGYRFDGDYLQDFKNSSKSRLNLSRFYGELSFGTDGSSVAFGRQSWNDDASLGRYDGVRLRYAISEDMRLTGVVGLAVDRKSDPMFQGTDRVVGVIGDYLGFGENTKLTGYLLQENRTGFVDRQVIGADGYFSQGANSGSGLLEFDTHLAALSMARASWSHRFEDTSSFTISAEYDHSPTLSLSAALTGQSVTSLAELATIYSDSEIKQLAKDRASELTTLSAAWQKPLNDSWQLSLDASAYNTGGSPATGGVPAVASQGWSYNASAQVVGTGVFSDSDVLSLALRGANYTTSNLVLIDSYWRYNVSDKLRIKPRLKVAHRTFANGTGTENFAIPSVSVNYDFNDSNSLEFETGKRISSRATPGLAEETNDTFLTIGLTKEF